MQKEIGSNFDLSPEFDLDTRQMLTPSLFGINGEQFSFVSTGRSAQKLVLETICDHCNCDRLVALIPPFTCETVITPFVQCGFKIFAYSVDDHLCINLESFRKQLYETGAKVVLVHRYFGFDTLEGLQSIIDEFSPRGVIFIEDKTQCLYSDHKEIFCDFVVSSLRKWGPVPDGGFAVSNKWTLCSFSAGNDTKLEQLKIEASRSKYAYLHEGKGEKQAFLDLYRQAEAVLDAEDTYYQISPASIAIQQQMDISQLKTKRRENYAYLYKKLENISSLRIVMPKLSIGDVPLYFVMSTEQREELQTHLRLNQIYAPIVWPKAKECPIVCSEVQELYDTVLCLPIDQRYYLDDMERMAQCIIDFLK